VKKTPSGKRNKERRERRRWVVVAGYRRARRAQKRLILAGEW